MADTKRPPKGVGSRAVPNPQLKASVPDGLYQRVLRECKRIGVDPPDFLRHAIAMALDAPRRREDVIALSVQLDEIRDRLDALEAQAKGMNP